MDLLGLYFTELAQVFDLSLVELLLFILVIFGGIRLCIK